jgi:hypothetical protein
MPLAGPGISGGADRRGVPASRGSHEERSGMSFSDSLGCVEPSRV